MFPLSSISRMFFLPSRGYMVHTWSCGILHIVDYDYNWSIVPSLRRIAHDSTTPVGPYGVVEKKKP